MEKNRDTIKRYGLVGKKVGYTLSPVIYSWFFKKYNINAIYYVIDIEDTRKLKSFITESRKRYDGFNITIPYKSDIINYLDIISKDAKTIGSVNTVTNLRGKLKGDNTDWVGFLKPLNMFIKKPHFMKAVVIGAGGAARAVVYALTRYVDEIVIFSKSGVTAEKLASDSNHWGCKNCIGKKFGFNEVIKECREAELIVNASPLGGPHAPTISPVPSSCVRSGQVVYDLNYKPKETRLIRIAKMAGATTISGIWMLLLQAVENIRIWFNIDVDFHELKKGLEEMF